MLFRLLLITIFSTYIFASKIQIAVSANVSYAIEELKREFNNLYPDINVKIILGGSGKLTAQIENGAPFDIFLSANMAYPNRLYKRGFAITKPLVYAKGSLALFSVKRRDFSKGLELLKNKDIKKVAIANPKTAPYGVASIEALKSAKIYDKIENKIVYGENISATFNYALKATDIGIVAKSLLYSPKLKNFKEGKNWISIDKSLYTPIKQGIVVLKNGDKKRDVALFFEFIFSKKAQDIFKKYGY
jgi:molybdate transport system substrate-binding protein